MEELEESNEFGKICKNLLIFGSNCVVFNILRVVLSWLAY